MARKKVEKNIAYDDIKKKYFVTFYYGQDGEGKPIKKTKSYDKITVARRELKEFEGDKLKDNVALPNYYTVSTWLDYWIDNIVTPNSSENTIYFYSQITRNHIKPALGKIVLQDLRPPKIQEYYIKKLKDGLSPNTVIKHHNLLKTALNAAIDFEVMTKNPTKKVKPPAPIATEKEFYSIDLMKQLFKKVKGTRLQTTVFLLALTGIRREEACGLTWDNVDFENRFIIINRARTTAGSKLIEKTTKTASSERRIAMDDVLFDILQIELNRQLENKKEFGCAYMPGNYVLVWDNGKPYRPNYLSELFTKFIDKNDMPYITLHGLRHSFASTANACGLTMYDISCALGHGDLKTTSTIYTHLQDKTHEKVIASVAKQYTEPDNTENN